MRRPLGVVEDDRIDHAAKHVRRFGHQDQSAGTQHAQHFAYHALGIGNVHQQRLTRHDVDGFARQRQLFGAAHAVLEARREAARIRSLLRLRNPKRLALDAHEGHAARRDAGEPTTPVPHSGSNVDDLGTVDNAPLGRQ
ncbi:MAG: hypothetical protein R3B13_21940 [Polyangiaceae bacterium]